jgi:hypothetical protein
MYTECLSSLPWRSTNPTTSHCDTACEQLYRIGVKKNISLVYNDEREREICIEWNSCVCNGISMLFFSSLAGYLMLRIRRCLLLWNIYMRSLSADKCQWSGGPKTLYWLIHNIRWLPLDVAGCTLKTIIFILFLFLVIDRPLVRYNITLPT